MPRPRRIPRSYYDTPTVPFPNAEEAWFWFIRCQKARADGARFEAVPGAIARPCDPDDLYRAVARAVRQIRPKVVPSAKTYNRQSKHKGRLEIQHRDGLFYVPVAASPLLASCFFMPDNSRDYSAASRCLPMMPIISAAAAGILVPGP
jgi:hypothetical protein